jgi:hypothetical protein
MGPTKLSPALLEISALTRLERANAITKVTFVSVCGLEILLHGLGLIALGQKEQTFWPE